MLRTALAAALLHGAPAAANGAGTMPAGGIAQALFGLVVVLALVGAAAWVLRRVSGMPGIGSGQIRIVGGAAVGQRERVVLVEIEGTWLLLGVAPGQVRTLHTMPKSATSPAPIAPAPADPSFAGWLRRMMEQRRHG